MQIINFNMSTNKSFPHSSGNNPALTVGSSALESQGLDQQSLQLLPASAHPVLSARELLAQAVKNLAENEQKRSEMNRQQEARMRQQLEESQKEARRQYELQLAAYNNAKAQAVEHRQKYKETCVKEIARSCENPVFFQEHAVKYLVEHKQEILDHLRQDLIGGGRGVIDSDHLTAHIFNKYIFPAIASQVQFPDAKSFSADHLLADVTTVGIFLRHALTDFFDDLKRGAGTHNLSGYLRELQLSEATDLQDLGKRLQSFAKERGWDSRSFSDNRRSVTGGKILQECSRTEILSNLGYYIYEGTSSFNVTNQNIDLKNPDSLENYYQKLLQSMVPVTPAIVPQAPPPKPEQDIVQGSPKPQVPKEQETLLDAKDILPNLEGLHNLKREMEIHLIRVSLHDQADGASTPEAMSQVDRDFLSQFNERANPGNIIEEYKNLPPLFVLILALMYYRAYLWIYGKSWKGQCAEKDRSRVSRQISRSQWLKKEHTTTEGVADLYNFINYVYRIYDQGMSYIRHGSDRQKRLGRVLLEVARINADMIKEVTANLEIKIRHGDTEEFAKRLRLSTANVASLISGSPEEVMALMEAAQEGLQIGKEISEVAGSSRDQLAGFDRRLAESTAALTITAKPVGNVRVQSAGDSPSEEDTQAEAEAEAMAQEEAAAAASRNLM